MSKKKGTNNKANKKNAKTQEKVQNVEQNEVLENEAKTSEKESSKVSKETKKVDTTKADKKAKKEQEIVPKSEYDELDDRYKRILAEFENFKKRSAKERESLYNSILSDVVEVMLPILDNLENAAKVETKDEEYKKGIELVLKQFQDTLKTKGVEEIKTVGETFDPELHEAVSSVQDDTKGEKEIVQEYRKGYMIGNKVIRHSMVIVAN